MFDKFGWAVIGVVVGGLTVHLIHSKVARKVVSKSNKKVSTKEEIWAKRRQFFCAAQSVSYSNSSPLYVVRGDMQWLIDDSGDRYLDTRNNVGHVGWQHPKVVEAVAKQMGLTNSNTRYLHDNQVLLAEKLLSTFPKALNKVFFVNSGSEANDLALRLAQAKTNTRIGEDGHCIVVERAYHGHTCGVIDISPYKFLGKGGRGQPKHIQVVSCPDVYRNENKDVHFFTKMVDDACSKIEEMGGKVTAFFVESGMSVAGVILPPKNYLKEIYAFVRKRGGVCVADEVQVGFGRFGDYYWGFQQQDVVPDIVTMGKPFGNGFPLAAVVCTTEVAQAFENGMEYFNTFGGNPVGCAAGLAVMEIIEQEGLQAHAKEVGLYLKQKLVELKHQPHGSLIGDVRGAGLFVGIEFVQDPIQKTPASKEVSFIATRLLRGHKILTSCDGPFENVLVMKPPMKFDKQNVDQFVSALSSVLQELQTIDLSTIQRTPT